MTRNVRNVDVAVIGAGTAGLNARRAALEHGARSVVLIEDKAYGTTCARVGCMPSKVLIQAADVAHEIRGAGDFGIRVSGAAAVDGAAVMERVRQLRDRFAGGVVRSTEAIPAEERLWGTARFVGPTTLDIASGPIVQAKAVVIATGSETFVPRALHGLGSALWTNDHVFEATDLPRRLAVIGTGIIALELGQAFHRLGVPTEFFSNVDWLGPLTDPVLRDLARSAFGRELTLHLAVDIQESGVRDTPHGPESFLRFKDRAGHVREAAFDRVLAATGRLPAVAGLDLPASGIPRDPRGIPIFNPTTMQCGDAPVFVAGDVTGTRAVLHEAADEGRIAGANAALYPHVRPGRRRPPLTVVFTDPQLAMAGLSHADVVAADVPFVTGRVDFGDQGRSRVMGKNLGAAHIYVGRRDGRVLGAEIIGPRAEHLAHLMSWAIAQNLTAAETLRLPFYHPVVEEGLRTALRDAAQAVGQREDIFGDVRAG